MLENWCVTACRLNESGSGSRLSDADSNLLCCQILESISGPSWFHCSPHQACCRVPAVPPSCVRNWQGNKTVSTDFRKEKRGKKKGFQFATLGGYLLSKA